MKGSRYNFFVTLDDKGNQLVYNVLSNYFIKVNTNIAELIQKVSEYDRNEVAHWETKIKQLKDMHFIVNDDFDELRYLQYRYSITRYSEQTLSITIAPTLKCNFGCTYCYEEPDNADLDESTINNLIAFVEKNIRNKNFLFVSWYGGEPLLAKDIIARLSSEFLSICDKNSVQYKAGIITNGFLVPDVGIDFFKDNKITSVQITLDGPPEIHDKRRFLKGNQSSTFWTIIKGLKLLEANAIMPAIRCNVDNSNATSIDELILTLKDAGIRKSSIYLAQVHSGNNVCSSVETNCIETEDFTVSRIEFLNKLKENGMGSIRSIYPWARSNSCGATKKNSYVLDPYGNVYKCWLDVGVGAKRIFNLNLRSKETYELTNEINYMLYDPFNHDKCKLCKFLPICLGGCPFFCDVDGEPRCDSLTYHLEAVLKGVYQDV